jgi:hypothetical protein
VVEFAHNELDCSSYFGRVGIPAVNSLVGKTAAKLINKKIPTRKDKTHPQRKRMSGKKNDNLISNFRIDTF